MATAFSAWDFIQYKLSQQRKHLPGKREFGRMMHNDELTDEEKREIAERVILAGGYDALEEDE